jgi:DNA-binding NarL/FixJ family response regulator
MIRLVVVEDHPIVLGGITHALPPETVQVVGDAQDVQGATTAVAALRPDVVLCDVMLGEGPAGFELPAALAAGAANAPVLFYSAYDLPWFHTRAKEVGAAGYVSKGESVATLIRAIAQVAAGELAYPAGADGDFSPLRLPSHRETEVTILVAEGLGTREIAARLGISPKTVESHLARLFTKYKVKTRTELAMLAVNEGWIAVGGRTRQGRT